MPQPIDPRVSSSISQPTSSPVVPDRTAAGARRLPSRVRALDDRTLRWMAGASHGWLDPVLRTTARADDALASFLAMSLWLWLDGRPQARSAVLRGGVATGLAAVMGNAVLKPVIGRGRPDPDRLPREQRRSASPSTSALPSGHLTAGAAFAVAAGHDVPRLRPLLALATVLVGYTKVYTARHYLSDVLSGMAVGAVAGALARRIPGSWLGWHAVRGSRPRHSLDRITRPPT